MAMSGLSVQSIGRALGHKDSRSTEVYARLQSEVVRDAVVEAHAAMERARASSAPPKLPVSK
jgi:site-specific recombinase XerD